MENKLNQTTAISTKKSSFLSLFGDLYRINALLTGVSAILGIICICLTFSVVNYILSPKPIYYIPGATGAGYSVPNEIPKSSIASFAASWLLTLLNFTPATIEQAHSQALKYLNPQTLSKIKYILSQEKEDALKSSISSIFTLSEDPTVTQKDKQIIVSLKGEHSLFIAQSNVKTTSVFYTITLEKSGPSELNPYGLVISKIEQFEKLKEPVK